MATQPRILVIGDIMLDRYVSGNVTRISPEAPVPVVKVSDEWSTLGGAANVAANVASLGESVVLCGLVGDDLSAVKVEELCGPAGIVSKTIKSSQPTIVKTRVVSGQQIVRFDKEEQLVWTDDQFSSFQKSLDELIFNCSVILLSDYAKGTLSYEILKLILALANEHDIKVLVDPKRADWSAYRGAFAVTPNLTELSLTQQGSSVNNEDSSIVNISKSLREDHAIENIVATRSSCGMTLVSENGILNIPTRALEVFDVSGAGDTVLAALGVSLAQGKTISQSVFIANAAAGIAVSKRGTATVKRSELDEFLKACNKHIPRDEIQTLKALKKSGRIIFTNGCFDVLHQGHRKLLKEASKLGKYLVVGLNSDSSVERLKGKERPINKSNERVEALEALPFVHAVVIFDEDTPYNLIKELRPDVIVKGGDYIVSDVVGNDLVDEVVIIPLVEGVSTTKLLSAGRNNVD